MNSIDEANLARSRQMSAALAVAELCEQRLPAVHAWKITGQGITAQLLHSGKAAVDELGEWSRYFGGARPYIEHVVNESSAHVAINSHVRALPLTVWAAMDTADVPDAWTEPQP